MQTKLSNELATLALRSGAKRDCPVFNKFRSAESKDDLVEMYMEGIDFCLSNEFPSNDFIGNHFVGIMENHGVYLDSVVNLVDPAQVVVLGDTKGDIRMDGYTVSQIFVKHQSNLKIKAGDNSFVMIDIFDDASMEIEASGDARVCINRYGGAILRHTEKGSAAIKIIEKHKKTY